MNRHSPQTFLHTYRHIFIFVCILIFIGAYVPVHAQDVVTATTTQANIDAIKALPVAGNFIEKSLAQIVYGISLGVGGMFAGLGAVLLDLSFSKIVLGFGILAGSGSGIGTGISELWTIVRDTLNIFFIFGLIYIGIKTILNSEDSGTRRTLGLLIVAALMINFSLYITQTIVDFSNIAAVQVYNQITYQGTIESADRNNAAAPITFTENIFSLGHETITGAFLDVAGVTSIFGKLPDDVSPGKILVFSIFMMIFLIVAGIVFAMGAFLLIGRFIALVIYMIFSPIMFLGFILPALSSYQQKWWRGFLKQAFFAPAFLFMLYLSLVVLQKLRGTIGITSADARLTDMVSGAGTQSDTFTLILFFAMMIGFLYASIKVAQMMGIAGAGASLNSLNAMGKAARGAVQGAAYRGTVGRGLNAFVGGIDRLDRAAESGNDSVGRRSARLARSIVGGESTRKAVEKASNYGAGGQGRDDVEKDEKARSQRAARGNEMNKITDTLKGNNQADKERAIADAPNTQLLEMLKSEEGKGYILANAGKLSTSQYEALDKSDEIDDSFRTQMGQNRGDQISERLMTNNGTTPRASIEEVIGKADVSDLKAIGFGKALIHAGKLSAKQIEDWKDLTPSEKNQIKDARKAQLKNEFGFDQASQTVTGAHAAALFKRINTDDERSKLSVDILGHVKSAEYLNTNVLTKIVDNPGITDTDRTAIKTIVMNYHNAAGVPADIKKYKEFFTKNNAGQRY